jgi:hypothetical protein
MDSLYRDLAYGLRSLRSNPGFTVVATVTIRFSFSSLWGWPR